MFYRLLVPSLMLLLAVSAKAGEPDAWDRAYDAATGTRFIPLQLIIGGEWDGERTITYPEGTFHETAEHASIWSGPQQWTHPKTGAILTAYRRGRGGRNAADQMFAVRSDGAAIGRVADSRFGISACAEEAKYPLGLWREGETRRFENTCWYGEEARAKVTTLTIRQLDFFCGWRHCLEVEWVLRDQGKDDKIDHRIYVFAPGHGVVNQRSLR